MNIVCPNCDAEYLFDYKDRKVVGKNLQCSHCKQKWLHYNIYREKKGPGGETNNLKRIALDEYRISVRRNPPNSFETTETDYNVQSHLKESSARLKKSKEELVDNVSKSSNKASFLDNSVVIGFSLISLLCIVFGALYLYNYEIQKLFPQKVVFLLEYREFVDHVIRAVQGLINLGSKLIV